jgi:polyisoprenoid-binding protein YceI
MKRLFPSFATTALLFALVLAGCQSEGSGSASNADSTAAGSDGQMQQASSESAPTVQAGTYSLDGAHSNIGFRIRHLGISSVEGHFDDTEATVTFPSQDLADMQTQATIQTASINTGNDDRDGHLRSGDFFNAEQYSEITFQSTNVNPTGGGNFEMTGDLTMKDTTQQVTLEGQYLGAVEGPQGNTHTGFEASGEINRQDFGLTWSQSTPGGELVVSDDVTLTLDVEAIRQGPAQGGAQSDTTSTG